MLLSGGIDSSFCLWQRAVAGLETRTHHVYLNDHEGRLDVEARACRQVLEYIKGIGGRVHHTESHVDFGRMWIPKNHHLWAYWAGVILASPSGKQIDEVVIPRHFDGVRGGPDGPVAKNIDRCFLGHIELLARRRPRLVYPMVHMTKADVIRAMPRELLELCWWCRRPQNGKPCHKCATCKLVDPALEGLGSSK